MLIFVACCMSWCTSLAASADRSDTLDIRKTIIHFNITDFVTKNIYAETKLLIKVLQNGVTEINLDLQNYTVDSVRLDNQLTSFVLTGNLLHVNTLNTLNMNDSLWVSVAYHGIPPADATWGGFNYVSNYAFQLGVGFTSQPHSFGRSWHPCFDNMVERSPYEFFVTTTNDKMAVCNGLLIDSVLNSNNTKTWHWKLDEEIPSYLASVAVSNYVFVQQTLTSIAGNTDALIACEPQDIPNVNGSFAHLQESFTMLENHFGNHVFPRVGYSLVPFNGGAMEHATNIAIGKVFIDGTLNYETLIAHELSHHWFGDDITCSSVEDMWLNEGFASYCENLHLEHTYGYDAYKSEMRDKHFKVLSRAHVDDDGYKAISPMDSLNTYGTTVYTKGADAIHSLRTYLGDSLFFNGLKQFVAQHKLSAVNSYQLRDALNAYSGKNLNDFFNNWIFAPGFTHFSIDSVQSTVGGMGYEVRVFLRQRKHKAPQYYSNVPLEVGFYDAQGQMHLYQLIFDGRCMELKVNLPFDPVMVLVDPNEKISDAVTEFDKMIKSQGTTNFNLAKCYLWVKGLVNTSDSSYVHIKHHWVAPDRFKQASNFPGYVLNDVRYWEVDGINLSNLKAYLRFDYNGTATNNYLDSSWVKNTEDSIRLFYRKDASEDWQFANDSLAVGGLNDKVGYVYSREVKNGEYCFGIKRSNYIDPLVTDAPNAPCAVVLQNTTEFYKENRWDIYPNPSSGILQIQGKLGLNENTLLQVFTMFGELVYSGKLEVDNQQRFQHSLNLESLPSGMYLVKLNQRCKKWTKF